MGIPVAYSKIPRLLAFLLCFFAAGNAYAQQDTLRPSREDSVFKNIPHPELGPNDTIMVPAKISEEGVLMPARTMENFRISKPGPPGMRERIEKWTRLRNAVYVTYPYAKRAGAVMNDINAKIEKMKEKEIARRILSQGRKNCGKSLQTRLPISPFTRVKC